MHESALYTSHRGDIAKKALLYEQARFKAWQSTPVIRRLAARFDADDLAKQVDIPAVYSLFGPVGGLEEGLLDVCLQHSLLQLP